MDTKTRTGTQARGSPVECTSGCNARLIELEGARPSSWLVCRVQWNRTRRRWLSRDRKPNATRAAPLTSRFRPSVPAFVVAFYTFDRHIWQAEQNRRTVLHSSRASTGCSKDTASVERPRASDPHHEDCVPVSYTHLTLPPNRE